MPFKSQAQRRKFASLLVECKISPQTFEEWNRETGSEKLPERVEPKAAAKSRAKPRPAEKARAKGKAKSSPRRRTEAKARAKSKA
jgi:hypothetical protein